MEDPTAPQQYQALLPKHIRKLIQQVSKTNDPAVRQEGYVYLDDTISPWGTVGTDEDYHERPDATAKRLKEELARYHKLEEQQIAVGNGTVALLDAVLRLFCNPHEDAVFYFTPQQHRVEQLAQLQALERIHLPLGPNFELPIYEISKVLTPNTKVMVVEHPNPITGTCCSRFDLIDLATSFDGIIVVDETAIDYAPAESTLELIKEYPNIIILQSFSGAWGLASLPVGVAFAAPALIQLLELVLPKEGLNSVAQRMAVKALYVPNQKDRIVGQTLEERHQMAAALKALPAVDEVYDSYTNTLLLKVEKPANTIEYLKNEALIVASDVSHYPGLEQCIRVSIGKGLENLRLIKALKEMPAKTSRRHVIWKTISTTLRQASSFLGAFKKILGV